MTHRHRRNGECAGPSHSEPSKKKKHLRNKSRNCRRDGSQPFMTCEGGAAEHGGDVRAHPETLTLYVKRGCFSAHELEVLEREAAYSLRAGGTGGCVHV